MDVTEMLKEVQQAAAQDYATRVVELYERTLKVYVPSQARYEAAIQATLRGAVNGFSTSTSIVSGATQ